VIVQELCFQLLPWLQPVPQLSLLSAPPLIFSYDPSLLPPYQLPILRVRAWQQLRVVVAVLERPSVSQLSILLTLTSFFPVFRSQWPSSFRLQQRGEPLLRL
jgi:hypothetical protein